MKKTRVAAKLFAGVAVAAALVLGSTTATTSQARDTGWGPMGVTVQAGHSVDPAMDTGWGPM
jgi:hypothetical protein